MYGCKYLPIPKKLAEFRDEIDCETNAANSTPRKKKKKAIYTDTIKVVKRFPDWWHTDILDYVYDNQAKRLRPNLPEKKAARFLGQRVGKLIDLSV